MLSRRGHSAGNPDHGNDVTDGEEKWHGLSGSETDLAMFLMRQETWALDVVCVSTN